jgi:hypothetical protein
MRNRFANLTPGATSVEQGTAPRSRLFTANLAGYPAPFATLA